jgi:hypothetical protein
MTDFSPKRVRIQVYDHTVSKFKSELMKNGFIASSKPFTKDTSYVTILTRADKIELLKKICMKCEIDVKQKN